MTAVLRYAADHRPISYAELSIERSIEAAMSRMSLRTHDAVRVNEVVEVIYGGVRRFRGYLEIDDGDRFNGYAVSARSLAVQLDINDAAGNESFSNTTMRAVVSAIAGAVGVAVGASVDAPVNLFRLKRGESRRAALQRLAEVKQVTITDDADGNLVIFALPDTVQAAATWTAGAGTVTLPFRRRRDFSDWRSEVRCRGARALVTADIDGDDAADIGIELAAPVARQSLKVIGGKAAATAGGAAALVDWEAKKRGAATASLTVTHGEWVADIGTVVRAIDRSQRIDDIMVVQGVRADLAARKFEYDLTFPAAYQPSAKIGTAISRAGGWL